MMNTSPPSYFEVLRHQIVLFQPFYGPIPPLTFTLTNFFPQLTWMTAVVLRFVSSAHTFSFDVTID